MELRHYVCAPTWRICLLVAIIDWYSRYVLSWEVSTTMESDFCLSALNRSLQVAKPEIFNTDQGSQFTSCAFTRILKEHEIAISMDGRGRHWTIFSLSGFGAA